MEEVLEFFRKAGVYYLATVEGDQPRVRAFGTVDIYEDKFYIQTGKVKPCSHQMKANPKVELCAFTDGKWMRLAGEAVLDERLEPQQHMLDAYPSLQGRYAAGDGNNEVFYIKNATATLSDFGGEIKTITW